MVTEKFCLRCQKTKPVKDWNKNRGKGDGLQTYCRACRVSDRSPSNFRHVLRMAIDRAIKGMKQGYVWPRLGPAWCLTEEAYRRLRTQRCTYCQGALPKTRGGLDRIDNDLGYVAGNVVTCCWSCNRLRSRMRFDEYVKCIAAFGVLPEHVYQRAAWCHILASPRRGEKRVLIRDAQHWFDEHRRGGQQLREAARRA